MELGFHNPSALERRHYRVGEEYPGLAALERHHIVVPDASYETNALSDLGAEEGFVIYLAQPLISKGQVQGVLELLQLRGRRSGRSRILALRPAPFLTTAWSRRLLRWWESTDAC